MAPDLDGEQKPPPPKFAAAAEGMLTLATKAGVLRPEESIPDRLLETLRLVARLHERYFAALDDDLAGGGFALL